MLNRLIAGVTFMIVISFYLIQWQANPIIGSMWTGADNRRGGGAADTTCRWGVGVGDQGQSYWT